MKTPIVVQRLENGKSRTEYYFKTLKQALAFIADSEDLKEGDGAYEIYMPRSNW